MVSLDKEQTLRNFNIFSLSGIFDMVRYASKKLAFIYISTPSSSTVAPRVTLKLGYNLDTRPVTEGEDVFFECEVASNPPPHTVTWYKDVSIIVMAALL